VDYSGSGSAWVYRGRGGGTYEGEVLLDCKIDSEPLAGVKDDEEADDVYLGSDTDCQLESTSRSLILMSMWSYNSREEVDKWPSIEIDEETKEQDTPTNQLTSCQRWNQRTVQSEEAGPRPQDYRSVLIQY
jgi:hypothetical protein